MPATHPAGPWGTADPIAWALSTGRLHPDSAERWAVDLKQDPRGTAAVLASLFPAGAVVAKMNAALEQAERSHDAAEDAELGGLFPPRDRLMSRPTLDPIDLDEPPDFAGLFPPGTVH